MSGDRRRRVTLVAEQVLAPVPGGTGRYTRQLLAHLPAAGRDLRFGSVTGWHADTAPAAAPGVDGPRRLPVPGRVLPLLWQRGLPPWPRGDLLHATTPLAPAGRRPLPRVVTVHDAVPFTHPDTLTAHGAHWHRVMIAAAAEHAAALVVPSRSVRDALADHLPAAARDRVVVIPLGVTVLDEELAPASTDPLAAAGTLGVAAVGGVDRRRRRARLELPPDYLVSVATLEPRKGLDVLVEALAVARTPMPLVVVGRPGWGGVDLPAAVAAAGLPAGQVVVAGGVSDQDLAAVLSGARALVAPSRAEGFGLPVLEAMAAGVAVVHSDIPPFRELAGDSGVAVPVGDAPALAAALQELWHDDDRRAALAAAGRARAHAFSWARTAAAHVAVYRAVLDGAPLPADPWGSAA